MKRGRGWYDLQDLPRVWGLSRIRKVVLGLISGQRSMTKAIEDLQAAVLRFGVAARDEKVRGRRWH